ncbi:hypothetical protein [Rhodococcus daqingensis]|uniref:DUF11 domain-containing protein n=1 Tax=Rhodococcus daqingensis TaxID=2479363 RepID=A0ABW2RTH2_9NOCA
MSRPIMRRVASTLAAATLLAAGGGIALGASAASAAPLDLGSSAGGLAGLDFGSSANGQELPASATVTADNLAITKVIVGSNTIAPTGTVTYRTTIAATGAPDRIITKIVDIAPPSLRYVEGSAKVTSWVDGQVKTEGVVPTESGGRLIAANDVGWVVSVNDNKTVSFEVTYQVRPDITFDTDIFDSGAAIEVSGQAPREWPEMGVKFRLLSSGGSSFFGS